jgi:hypothetical protein
MMKGAWCTLLLDVLLLLPKSNLLQLRARLEVQLAMPLIDSSNHQLLLVCHSANLLA